MSEGANLKEDELTTRIATIVGDNKDAFVNAIEETKTNEEQVPRFSELQPLLDSLMTLILENNQGVPINQASIKSFLSVLEGHKEQLEIMMKAVDVENAEASLKMIMNSPEFQALVSSTKSST